MALDLAFRIVYVFLGVVLFLLGVSALFVPYGWAPQFVIEGWLADETLGHSAGHALQVLGTVFMAFAVAFFWYTKRQDSGLGFHWAVTFYFFLNAVVHWFRPEGFTDSWSSGVINSVPFFLLLLLGMLRRRQIQHGNIGASG